MCVFTGPWQSSFSSPSSTRPLYIRRSLSWCQVVSVSASDNNVDRSLRLSKCSPILRYSSAERLCIPMYRVTDLDVGEALNLKTKHLTVSNFTT